MGGQGGRGGRAARSLSAPRGQPGRRWNPGACPWPRESRRSPLGALCLQPGLAAARETRIVTGPSCTRRSAVPKSAVTAGHRGTASPSHARAKRSDGLAAIRGAWGRAPALQQLPTPTGGTQNVFTPQRYLLSTSCAPGTILCGKNIKPRGEGGAWRTWSGLGSLRLGGRDPEEARGGGWGPQGRASVQARERQVHAPGEAGLARPGAVRGLGVAQ